ncbi:tellurite resistance protein [Stella humosa]|uniref:Tellurite resistance protein n=1 Tax=Stella humosa TaxID=94 RepID=A0A3N1L7G0_9PROT|nr:SLAC1 anion channel family protein [Stella humosa]ROP90543.1 tellurite resistance protein [Stella humosa]BBK29562.1 transporter [Stella humosa]
MNGLPGPAALASPDLRHFPLPLFASVMGLMGLSFAWRRAAIVFPDLPAVIGEAILALAVVWFLVVAGLYAAKAATRWPDVLAEARHPARANFLTAISIAVMLIGTGLLPHAPRFAEAVWLAGVAGNVALAVVIIRRWILERFEPAQVTPAWFIPVVGNVVPPLAGVELGYVELSWFCFAGGLGFWLVLFPLTMGRLFTGDPLPPGLSPMLFIFLAPPSVGFLSWLELNGGVLDAAANFLFHLALFIALCLAAMAPRFLRVPWSLISLAYTFPLAALAAAALRYHQMAGSRVTLVLAAGLLMLASAVVAAVFAGTVRRFVAGAFFRPEP